MAQTARPLRTHQAQIAAIVRAIAAGEATDVTDILAAVKPGGGKSLLPVIAAHALQRRERRSREALEAQIQALRERAEDAEAEAALRRAELQARQRDLARYSAD